MNIKLDTKLIQEPVKIRSIALYSSGSLPAISVTQSDADAHALGTSIKHVMSNMNNTIPYTRAFFDVSVNGLSELIQFLVLDNRYVRLKVEVNASVDTPCQVNNPVGGD